MFLVQKSNIIKFDFTHFFRTVSTVTENVTISATFKLNTAIDDVAGVNVKVYPNPAKDVIYIEGDVVNVVIYNSSGQMVKKGIDNGQIDVTSLENGIYYLVITCSDESRKVEKVIIAR